MTHAKTDAVSAWLSYRPEIHVLDCTIRDGGLMNNHLFDEAVVKAVYQANVAAGVDIMEFGYKQSPDLFDRSKFGPWKFCDESDLRSIVGNNETDMKISVMADAGRCNLERDLMQSADSVIDMVRVACYIHQVPEALDMLQLCHERGYETTINLMALSAVPSDEWQRAIATFGQSPAKVIYIVDSFGSLYSEQVHSYIAEFRAQLTDTDKELGIHAHNNQNLAYANTLEAITKGVNYLDASMAGLGRGAGNCQMELLMGFLHNPSYHLRPLLNCIQTHILPMQEKLKWGFDIPYMITGQLNQHPRTAMAFNESKDRGDYVAFYDSIMSED